ncbi:MAG: 30S ribosomal protein S9 [Opitutales bacterium]
MTDSKTVYVAIGRRKTASARVRLSEGTGSFTINNHAIEDYFRQEQWSRQAAQPLSTVDFRDKVDVNVRVNGGGVGGQSIAVAHGVARALLKMDAEMRIALKRAGHLTRDPREKERKKPGQPGARKRFQFSKR